MLVGSFSCVWVGAGWVAIVCMTRCWLGSLSVGILLVLFCIFVLCFLSLFCFLLGLYFVDLFTSHFLLLDLLCFLFSTAKLLVGIGGALYSSLGLVYIEEGSKPHRVPLYFGKNSTGPLIQVFPQVFPGFLKACLHLWRCHLASYTVVLTLKVQQSSTLALLCAVICHITFRSMLKKWKRWIMPAVDVSKCAMGCDAIKSINGPLVTIEAGHSYNLYDEREGLYGPYPS